MSYTLSYFFSLLKFSLSFPKSHKFQILSTLSEMSLSICRYSREKFISHPYLFFKCLEGQEVLKFLLRILSNVNALLFSRSVYCKPSVTPILLVITIIITFPSYSTNNYMLRRVCFICHYNLSDSLSLTILFY